MIHKNEFPNFDLFSNNLNYLDDFLLPKEIVRYFKVKNVGNLPIKFERMSIEQNGCRGFGFEIRNCHSFSLNPNGHHIIEIAFSLDYSQKQAHKILYLSTKKEILHFHLHVDLPFLANYTPKNKSHHNIFEGKMIEGVSLLMFIFFIISLMKSLKYKSFIKKKARGEWKLVEASDIFELRDQNSVFSFENDIYELRKLRQAVKQTSNYTYSLLFEPIQSYEGQNILESGDNLSIEKKLLEARNNLQEQGNQGKQIIEDSEKLKEIGGEEDKRNERNKNKKEEKSKKNKTQEKKKNVKKENVKPKKNKKEEEIQEKKEFLLSKNDENLEKTKETIDKRIFFII